MFQNLFLINIKFEINLLTTTIDRTMDYFPTTALAETTRKLHNRTIERWLEVIGHKATIMTIVNNPKIAMNHLRRSETITHTPENHRLFIGAVTCYVKHELVAHKDYKQLFDVWYRLMKVNEEPIVARRFTGEPTERQKEKMIDWETVCKVRDELPLSPTKILLAMYSYIPPQRGGDFYDLKVYTKEPKVNDGNYIVLKSHNHADCRLVMNDYKTEKVYGEFHIPLAEPLVKLLTEYWSKYNNPHNALFIKSDKEEPYDRKMFSAWATRRLTEVFGKPMTLTAIRHSFISAEDFNKPMIEIKNSASAMSHSVGQHLGYKWEKKTE